MSFWRNNGLSIVLLAATVLTIGGMFFSGLQSFNQELSRHGQAPVAAFGYLASGHFLSALFENWESEFLQMAAYVVLTAFLFQKGSAESKDPEGAEEVDEDPATRKEDHEAPWPVRATPWTRALYSYSLGIALGLLFIASFALHLRFSVAAANLEAQQHGGPLTSAIDHMFSSEFWFESFQNWQSEFLSTAMLVILSIFLRFRGSPESKPVASPHVETGA
jgi:hypothetical protein